MDIINSQLEKLKTLLEKERKSQILRWENEGESKKELRKAGELLHPLKVIKHGYDYSSSPYLTVHYPNNYNERLFSNGTPVVLYDEENERCNGTITRVEKQEFEVQLHAEEISTWILNEEIAMKPKVDEKSFTYMLGLLNTMEEKQSSQARLHLRSLLTKNIDTTQNSEQITWMNNELNDSQKESVKTAIAREGIVSIQGPPGTGKTTTLVELIQQINEQKEKVIASAPSNAAVDHLATKLILSGAKVVRLGNTAKIDSSIWQNTPEGILAQPEHQKKLKKLRKEVEALQMKAQQFKRNFTAEDRENRKRWRKEANEIKKEIRSITSYILSKAIKEADVLVGTPVGLCNSLVNEQDFDVAVIDEAGQCLIPMAFLVMDNAEKVILCGDQQQLPPTVINQEAEDEGLGKSILEFSLGQRKEPDCLLRKQYRMPPQIANFSSEYFYHGAITSSKENKGEHLFFYDTAGAGYQEQSSENGSKWNHDEIEIVKRLVSNTSGEKDITVISPYSAQIRKIQHELGADITCSTIDGFQGQENNIIIISLVRSNEDGKIGFLKDYRRMNVAMTRAKDKLFVIGDSTTLGGDPFYQSFIAYCEQNNCYHSVFELLY